MLDRTKYLDPEEVRRLRTVAEAWTVTDLAAGRRRGPLVWMLVDVALGSGLRVGELARLTVGDFDPKRRALRVWRLKRREPIQETLPLARGLTDHLGDYVAWMAAVGQPCGRGDALLCGERGPLTTAGLARAWSVAIHRAGLPAHYSIHSARHTRGTSLLAATGNLRLVQQALGHKSITSTAVYAGVTFDALQQGLDAADNPTE